MQSNWIETHRFSFKLHAECRRDAGWARQIRILAEMSEQTAHKACAWHLYACHLVMLDVFPCALTSRQRNCRTECSLFSLDNVERLEKHMPIATDVNSWNK